MKLQMSFGENLINLRKQKGWSQDDLADNLNLSRQAISKWENDTSKPDIDNIKKISKVFSVTIDDLLNNDVVKDKAVTLNVKKQEKKEKTITIVKCMIIAVIILYIINVIFKFASLLIIVNGIQKYANLSNYHYVITTYDENGLKETEESWYKDGILKTSNKVYNGNTEEIITTYIDYNENYGYMKSSNDDSSVEINVNNYKLSHINYEFGGQIYIKIPNEIRNNNILYILYKAFDLGMEIEDKKGNILIKIDNSYILVNKKNLLPLVYYTYDEKKSKLINYCYKVEIDSVENIIKEPGY